MSCSVSRRNCSVHGDLADVPAPLADDARAALREALSNVVRHSGATTVRVDAPARPGPARCCASTDDGCGIPRGVTRRGLRHLEERAAAAGGHSEITSSARTGTTITWQVPLS